MRENIPIDFHLMPAISHHHSLSVLAPELPFPSAVAHREPGVSLCSSHPIAIGVEGHLGEHVQMLACHRQADDQCAEPFQSFAHGLPKDGAETWREHHGRES